MDETGLQLVILALLSLVLGGIVLVFTWAVSNILMVNKRFKRAFDTRLDQAYKWWVNF